MVLTLSCHFPFISRSESNTILTFMFRVLSFFVRPGVKRILVVLVDKKSVGDTDDTKKLQAAKELYGEDVVIIPVAIGDEADPTELSKLTDRKDAVIKESTNITPEELAKKIMGMSFSSKLLHTYRRPFLFAGILDAVTMGTWQKTNASTSFLLEQ